MNREKLELRYVEMLDAGTNEGEEWVTVCNLLAKYAEDDYYANGGGEIELNMENQDLVLGGYMH